MALGQLLSMLGDEIEDPEEETFLLFSQSIPSQNLGFVDAKATKLEINIAGRDLTITQSPGLLVSERDGGTTGAMVWMITPLFAEWISRNDCILYKYGILHPTSAVLELGCGISGLVAITMAPKIGKYIATDQDYVFKLLKSNIDDNTPKQRVQRKNTTKTRSCAIPETGDMGSNIQLLPLDWEISSISELPSLIKLGSQMESQIIDVVIACDCIYNESLIEPFVTTCAEACRSARATLTGTQTLCVIAQQLRSDTVFEAWLSAFNKRFKVWRVSDEHLIEGLRGNSGLVVHMGILR